jgi:plasmid stability protein
MWQMTVRHLDADVVQGLKIRAAAAGRSLEDEVRTILSDTVRKQQAAPVSAWSREMHSKRREFFGGSVFAGSEAVFGTIVTEGTRPADEWASATPRFYEK